jgi:hypothetical protein
MRCVIVKATSQFSFPRAAQITACLIAVTGVHAHADVVTDWSTIAYTTIVQSPGAGAVHYAIAQTAVYDAVNAIDGKHAVYAVDPAADANGASHDAAAIAAAYHTLVALFPAHATNLANSYSISLAAVPDGGAKAKGVALGSEVASSMVALRANDGRNAVVPYVFGSGPGVYQRTPPAFGNPVATNSSGITPFSLLSTSQFRAYGPPDLTSAVYTRDLEETRAYGSLNSSVRTPEQTDLARFHTENPNQLWGRNITRLVREQNLGTAGSARLLAALAVAQADATLACFDSKYHFNFWRPVTAIAAADADGNPATEADPSWLPVVNTPPHPEYPAAHGCVSAAIGKTLEYFTGHKRLKFTMDSVVTGTTRTYHGAEDLVREIINARVYGGMHFRNSSEHGAALGRQVAKWVARNEFRRVKKHF